MYLLFDIFVWDTGIYFLSMISSLTLEKTTWIYQFMYVIYLYIYICLMLSEACTPEINDTFHNITFWISDKAFLRPLSQNGIIHYHLFFKMLVSL